MDFKNTLFARLYNSQSNHIFIPPPPAPAADTDLPLEVLECGVLEDDARRRQVLREKVQRDVVKVGPGREDVLVSRQAVTGQVELDVGVRVDDARQKHAGHLFPSV